MQESIFAVEMCAILTTNARKNARHTLCYSSSQKINFITFIINGSSCYINAKICRTPGAVEDFLLTTTCANYRRYLVMIVWSKEHLGIHVGMKRNNCLDKKQRMLVQEPKDV